MSPRKKIKKWKRRAERAGWRINDTGRGGHEKWYAPYGDTIVVVSVSPSCPRALANTRSHLRRAGLNI